MLKNKTMYIAMLAFTLCVCIIGITGLNSNNINGKNVFLTACENAGVTKACEADLSIQEWLNNYVANGWV